MPLRQQCACCFTKKYKNFGCRVTSPTESSNFSVKSFSLTAKNNAFRLFKALQAHSTRQVDVLNQKIVIQSTKVQRDYISRAYLGSLPTKVSFIALNLINEKYKIAKAAIPTASRPARPLKPCEECTVPLQYGVPCRHKIYSVLTEPGKTLRLWDVNPHWHLRLTLDIRDPYLRIVTLKLPKSLAAAPRTSRSQCLHSMLSISPSREPHMQMPPANRRRELQ